MNRANLVRFGLLALIWGASFLLIKVALEGMTAPQVVLGRLSFGIIVLLVVMAAQRQPLPRDLRVWGHLTLLALVANVGPFFLFAWAESGDRVTSGLAGVLNGMPVFDMTDGSTKVLEPAFLKGLEFAVDLVEKHQVGNKPDTDRGFENGVYAMVEQTNTAILDYQKAGLEFGLVHYPLGPDTAGQPPSFVNSIDHFIFKSSPAQEEAAIRFAQWFTDTAQQVDFAIATGRLPVRQSARVSPTYQEHLTKNPAFKVFDGLLDSKPVTVKATPNLTKKRELVAKQWDLALNVKLTPKEAMAEAAKQCAPLDEDDKRALGF